MDAATLRSLLSYDAVTGAFVWRVRPSRRTRAGDIAGCVGSHGYTVIGWANKVYLAHRLAWLHVHGQMPGGLIDHINGDRTDNRIANLRVVDTTQNQKNRKVSSSSALGISGVKWRANRFEAQINGTREYQFLGRFESLLDAAAARRSAENRLQYVRRP